MICSFCSKSRKEVQQLVASLDNPNIAICDECVACCSGMIAEQNIQNGALVINVKPGKHLGEILSISTGSGSGKSVDCRLSFQEVVR